MEGEWGSPRHYFRLKVALNGGQQDSSTAGGRWRRQVKTELDGEKWSVDYATLGATRLSQVSK